MAHIITNYHLYQDCEDLKGFSGNWLSSIVVRSSLFKEECSKCTHRLADSSDEIDDFNSVWFGLGPDMLRQPVRAGNKGRMIKFSKGTINKLHEFLEEINAASPGVWPGEDSPDVKNFVSARDHQAIKRFLKRLDHDHNT